MLEGRVRVPSEGSTGEVVVLARGRISSPTVGYDALEQSHEPRPDTDLPDRIGRYLVLEVVGVGGMGVVCTAYDPKLDRKVALKLLREREFADAKRTTTGHARLHREARALAKLKHVNVVAVHDVDVVDERLYIAMEYVEGEPLSRWFEQRARTWREIVEVFVQAARGMVAAHAAGITHRDFKPANVRIEPHGRVVVLDFGLALEQGASDGPDTDVDELAPERDGEHRKRLTAVGRRVGTPAYMAPEQILGQPVGPAADQFSFGVSLYEALYGTLPFAGDLQSAMWNAIDGKLAPTPKDREVPGWLHRVVLRMLAPHPDQRYPDMAAVIVALEQHVQRRRRRVRLALGGSAAVAAAALAIGFAAAGDACPGARERVDAVWNPERAQAISAAFVATGVPFAEKAWERTREVFDERATSWASSHIAICQATAVRGEQSAELLDTRMECLDQRLRQLGALLDVLGNADAPLIENATGAALRLGQPHECIELRPGSNDAPPSSDELPRVSQVRDGLARVEAELEARHGQAALALAEQVWGDAGALEHASTRLQARLVLGRARGMTGDAASAETDLRAVVEDAAAAQQSSLEATAWVHLLQVLSGALRRPDDALALRFPAEVAVQRAGAPAQLKAAVAHAIGGALSARGDHAAAAEQFRRAIDVRLAAFGDTDPDLPPNRSDLGITLVRLGQYDEAEQQFRSALDAVLQLYGPDHPLIAALSLNLGNALTEGKHDLAGAQQLYARALTINEAAFGPDHPKVAGVLVAQGSLARRRGDYDDAVRMFERARDIFTAQSADDPRIAMTLNNLGMTLAAQGRLVDAEAAYSRAIELFRKTHGERHVSLARSLGRRCEMRVALGRVELAARDCADALSIAEGLFESPHRDIIDARLATVTLRLAEHRGVEAVGLARVAVAEGLVLKRSPDEQLASTLELARALHAVDPRDPELARVDAELAAATTTLQDRPLIDRIEAWLRVDR
jgi:eukaryotic-like serine/threonine-protein kinase